jgi:hypothetical protein
MLVLCSRNARPEKEGGSRQTILLARRAPTMKRWSLDARSEGQSGNSPDVVRSSLDHGYGYRWTCSGDHTSHPSRSLEE